MAISQARRVEELFSEAVDLPPEQRHALLDARCAGDGELRKRVERLLRADAANASHDGANGDAAGAAGTIHGDFVVAEFAQEQVPRRVGAYVVRGIAGEGGMGAVFDATHQTTARRAAVKLVR